MKHVGFSSNDGAALGILPNVAMQAALGGPIPPESERMDRVQLLAWIEAAPERAETYDDATRMIAKAMHDFVRRHPEIDVRRLDVDHFMGHWVSLEKAEHDALMERSQGASVFMIGWAYNAVRSILGMESVGNRALAEFEVE